MSETCLEEAAPLPSLRFPGVEPFVSVLVPVRNEVRHLRATLTALLEQDYDPHRFEVLVADGRSTDGTPELVRDLQRDYPNLRLLDNPGLLASAGRNAAARASRGDLLVVVDGHCELDGPDYLANVAAAFDRSGADCLGRPQPLDVTGAAPLQRAIALARASRLGHNPDSHIYSSQEGFVRPQSVAVAYRREVFEAVGLFDEAFDACEDVELNHRVEQGGFRCFFTPTVRVRYQPRNSLRGLFRQLWRYGRGRVRLYRKHPESLTLPILVPACLVLALLAGPLLALAGPAFVAVWVGMVALYTALVALGSLGLAARAGDWRVLPWLPPVFFAIHAGAGAGLLHEALLGRRGAGRPEARLAPRRRPEDGERRRAA